MILELWQMRRVLLEHLIDHRLDLGQGQHRGCQRIVGDGADTARQPAHINRRVAVSGRAVVQLIQ